ncbi:MAG: helix-turn-helix domain-containing protein [Flavobacteriales bacterium]
MPKNIITTEDDLREFKLELLDDLKKLIHTGVGPSFKKYLRSSGIMVLLGMSSGTLQNDTIPYSKLRGVIYYDEEGIHKIFLKNSVQPDNYVRS